MNSYHELISDKDAVVAFVDFQPQMLFGVADKDRAALINNVVLMAKAAKEFNVPVVMTGVETEGFSGYVWPQLMEVATGMHVIERKCMNAWDSPAFRVAVEATGRKNVLLLGLWTEVCVAWPALSMLAAGYNVYIVEDCCGGTSDTAQQASLSRMVQAGAVRVTALEAVLEWQRDWKNMEHYDALMTLLRFHAGAYGVGVEYVYTMVHHAPQATSNPHVVARSSK